MLLEVFRLLDSASTMDHKKCLVLLYNIDQKLYSTQGKPQTQKSNILTSVWLLRYR